jgi:nicotinic acid mononucleotide adenylyltransferase
MSDGIVILGGAFNPIHTQHVALLCRVKDELEINKQWNIIGGYFAVASDNYVREKLRLRHERTISIRHRLALVHQAINDVPWLVTSPFQNDMLTKHDGSAYALSQRLIKRFTNKDIQIFIVIGGDRIMKHNVPRWRSSRARSMSTISVGIGRDMNDTRQLNDLWQNDWKRNAIVHPNQFILLNTCVESVSSTMVRSYLEQWSMASSQRDEQQKIEHELTHRFNYLHVNVMNYIREHHHCLYIET